MQENTHPPTLSEKEITETMEGLWLTYFNDTLYAHGVITEAVRNRMRVMIKARAMRG